MKNLFSSLIIISLALGSCNEKHKGIAKISGEIQNPSGTTVKVSNSDTSYYTSLNDKGLFQLTLMIDSSSLFNLGLGAEQTVMYIKPGDDIHISVDQKRFDETINYSGSSTSNFLAKKYLFWEKTDFYCRHFYLSTNEEYSEYAKEVTNGLIEDLMQISDTNFVVKERADIKSKLNKIISNQGYAQNNLQKYDLEYRIFLMKLDSINKYYKFREAIKKKGISEFNDYLNQYVESIESLIKTVPQSKKTARILRDCRIIASRYRKEKESIEQLPKLGEKAIDFTYSNRYGEKVSLSSFEGNLVYVDVWATWCGPCINQLPALKELSEDYKSKDVIFLGISVDSDTTSWINMLNKKQLSGIQLIANDDSSGIVKDYLINSYPRFMLFDKNGTVISTDSPWPSSCEIRDLINSYL